MRETQNSDVILLLKGARSLDNLFHGWIGCGQGSGAFEAVELAGFILGFEGEEGWRYGDQHASIGRGFAWRKGNMVFVLHVRHGSRLPAEPYSGNPF